MKLLTFSTLYPNNVKKNNGIFVEQRLRKLLRLDHIDLKVVAPVPWFPFKSDKFGEYANFALVSHQEKRNSIQIYHPKYFLIPKIGMTLAPLLLAIGTLPLLKRLIKEGFNFELIDAHYFYPDGVAAVILGKLLKKPVIITARGTDINLIPNYFLPRKMILWAAKNSKANITVSQALKDKLEEIGVKPNSIHTLRNGVDLDFFVPIDRDTARENLDLKRLTILSVGNLIELKGHHLIIEAMQDLLEFDLLIVGGGPDLSSLKKLINTFGVTDRVRLLGTLSQQQLVEVYNAADVLILASSREGLANVLLESMACGTPVVATNIGGTPEVIKKPEAGILIKERTVKGIVDAVTTLFDSYPDRNETRNYAEGFSWQETVDNLLRLMKQSINIDNRKTIY
jgi:glycosyltransferase involved in cell wall biosynthesis